MTGFEWTMLAALAGLTVAAVTVALFLWRLSDRVGAVETRLVREIGAVETRLGERVGAVETRLGERVGAVETRLGERVARIEGLLAGMAHPGAGQPVTVRPPEEDPTP